MKVTIEGSDKIVGNWVKALRVTKGLTITSEDGTVLSKYKTVAAPVEEVPKEVETPAEEPIAEQGSETTEEVTEVETPAEELKDKKKKGK